tara:strand:- start:356 stop:649 length:294 start_codon:yes stop_codon:yes gene_type:complete
MNFKKNFKIGNIFIGEHNKCLIIAEISANHNNNFNTIKKLINSAKKHGADIIKIQTYTADTLTIKSNKKDFQIKKKIHGVKIKTYGIYIKKLKLQKN